MTTTITHSCGHTIEHGGDFTDAFSDMLSRRECRDCFRARYEADVAAAREASKSLPALKGSEKQIAWATKIRAETIEKHPALRALAVYLPDVRSWIDWRDEPKSIAFSGRKAAIKAENFAALAQAVGLELGAWATRRGDEAHDAPAEIANAWSEALWFVFGVGRDNDAAAHTVNWISAERGPFVAAVTETCPALSTAGRAALNAQIDAATADAQKRIEKQDQAAAAARAAKAAEEAAAKAAELAAAERAKAHREALAKRWAPFRGLLAPRLEWDAEDGYWTRRRNKRFESLTIDELERFGATALRVVAALPNKAALKAAESVYPLTLLSKALDAQALAAIVGASAARSMHIAAGLPKPVIKKAAKPAGETQKAPTEAGA